ncbi:mercuric reductase [Botrimarina hoheduenensis]|uniref:Mercuric reductase n=1 Tax=Botrimarina hoheduenensis TaxID=2528000 RepID=A0A5C5VTS3_9BACT|nr:mercuric reductase [Botrimarina hoheduenensis]TWT41533.1 Mercuric reductase [Botrimarina hoheduenensis]
MPTFPELLPATEANLRLEANVAPPDWKNPPAADRYHLVVLGAGTAGLVTAAAAAGLGARVALIERRLMGGDCLNVGCVPSKGVIAAARAAAAVRDANRFGVHVAGGYQVDFSAAMERMRRLRADISPHDSAERFTLKGVDVFRGEGHFAGDNTLAVTGMAGSAVLRYRRAVIATGGRAAAPPIPGLDSIEYLTNETVFSLTELPESLAVVGGGPIGCELAQAFARLGSRVTLFTDDKGIFPRDDADAAPLLAASLERDGVQLLGGGTELSVAAGPHSRVIVSSPHGQIIAQRLLIAVGRAPNVEGLGLDVAGVEVDPRRGIRVNDRLQTTNAHIYAAGDVCSPAKFTHAADFQARLVVRNALMPWPANRGKASSLVIPWCTYTSPEVAGVGLTEQQARGRGVPVDTYRIDLREIDRSLLEGETEGFVKLITSAGTDKIVGATIVAPNAGDMIGEVSLAMTHGIGLGKIAGAIHPYPTVGEAIRKLGDQYNRTKLTSTAQWVLAKWFAWTK